MTDYSKIDFSPLLAAAEGEVVTHSYVRDIALPSGGTMALITLDNGEDYTRPNTLGPLTLRELNGVLDELPEGVTPPLLWLTAPDPRWPHALICPLKPGAVHKRALWQQCRQRQPG